MKFEPNQIEKPKNEYYFKIKLKKTFEKQLMKPFGRFYKSVPLNFLNSYQWLSYHFPMVGK
jgi:hypothetical protein